MAAMTTFTIRRSPWTCEWGRFGVAIQDFGAGRARVDDVFWACHHPDRATDLRLMKRGECERCPYWLEAAHMRAEC